MSFSQEVKNELCRHSIRHDCCALAEAYGALLLCNTFQPLEVRVLTSSEMFASRIPALFARAFGIQVAPPIEYGGKYSILIEDRQLIRKIFHKCGYDPSAHVTLHLNGWIIEKDCCRSAFLRGLFLAGGFAMLPEKQYQLELVTPHAPLARELAVFFAELELSPKLAKRGDNNVLYMKGSESIEDFLTLSGAPLSAMRIMNAKALKDIRNNINRRVNFENANISKTVDAMLVQADAIRVLRASGALEKLSPGLRDAARLRIEHPDAPLSELAALSESGISKSGLNHRLQKLVELAAGRRPPCQKAPQGLES